MCAWLLCLPGAAWDAQAAAGKAEFPEAYRIAVEFSEFLRTDSEREAKYKERIAIRLAEDGFFSQAVDLLGGVSMSEWRRPQGMAGVAAIAAQAGEMDLARELTGRASAEIELHGDWRRARVAAEVVAALGEQGRFEEARPLWATLEGHDGERDYAAGRLCAAAARLNRSDAWGELSGGDGAGKSSGLVTSEANALVNAAAWCQTRGDAGRAKEFAARARGLAEGLLAWDGSGLMAEVATQLRMSGLQDDARAMLDEAETVALALPDGVAWKAQNLVRVADALLGFGDRDRAGALLEVAARQPALLQPLERGESAAAVAYGYQRLHGGDEAARRWLAAAEVALKDVTHHRVRSMSVIDTCLAMGKAGVAPSESVRACLGQVRAIVERDVAAWEKEFGPPKKILPPGVPTTRGHGRRAVDAPAGPSGQKLRSSMHHDAFHNKHLNRWLCGCRLKAALRAQDHGGVRSAAFRQPGSTRCLRMQEAGRARAGGGVGPESQSARCCHTNVTEWA